MRTNEKSIAMVCLDEVTGEGISGVKGVSREPEKEGRVWEEPMLVGGIS
jgi:hypothetical protein